MGSNCSGAGGGFSPSWDAGHDVKPLALVAPPAFELPEFELPPQAAKIALANITHTNRTIILSIAIKIPIKPTLIKIGR
jgi:hypothetical protein